MLVIRPDPEGYTVECQYVDTAKGPHILPTRGCWPAAVSVELGQVENQHPGPTPGRDLGSECNGRPLKRGPFFAA